MGLFFKAASQDALVDEFKQAVLGEPPGGTNADQAAEAQARQHVANAKAATSGLAPNTGVFIGAALVLFVLIGASYLIGVEADKIAPEKASQVRDLGAIVQGLITAWSGAAIGLIAGEAVGQKSK